MEYLVIGAGGTGGCIAGYMGAAGKDVTVIARGAHLAAIKENGLKVETTARGILTAHIKASTMEDYTGSPDVIFVCVKGYSLDSVVPFIKRIAKASTIVVPILNIYGTGAKLQKELPELLVTDGCIYVASQIKEPGVIKMNGEIFRVVFGVRNGDDYISKLEDIKQDLDQSGINGILSGNIRRDCLLKFSYVSPQGACGLYYSVPAGPIQQEGEIRDFFAQLISEINDLAIAMNIKFREDIVARNLAILDNLSANAETSLQRDVAGGKNSEIDGLIYEVVRMADEYGVEAPAYRKAAAALKSRGL